VTALPPAFARGSLALNDRDRSPVGHALNSVLTTGTAWQAHWIDDGPEEKLVFYCPECAERELEARD
jgi:hypothetical protein